MIRSGIFVYLRHAILAVTLLATWSSDLRAQIPEEDDLLALNARLLQAQIVERDASLLEPVALPQFHVLAPGGLVEHEQQATRGVAAWDVAFRKARPQGRPEPDASPPVRSRREVRP